MAQCDECVVAFGDVQQRLPWQEWLQIGPASDAIEPALGIVLGPEIAALSMSGS